MNFAFFCSYQKWEIIKFIKIEAQTASQTNKGGFLLFFSDKFKFKHFFGL